MPDLRPMEGQAHLARGRGQRLPWAEAQADAQLQLFVESDARQGAERAGPAAREVPRPGAAEALLEAEGVRSQVHRDARGGVAPAGGAIEWKVDACGVEGRRDRVLPGILVARK